MVVAVELGAWASDVRPHPLRYRTGLHVVLERPPDFCCQLGTAV